MPAGRQRPRLSRNRRDRALAGHSISSPAYHTKTYPFVLTSCHNFTRLKKVFNLFNCFRTRTRIPFFDFFHNGWIEDYSISIRQLPPIESILPLNVERISWHVYCCPISTNQLKRSSKEFI